MTTTMMTMMTMTAGVTTSNSYESLIPSPGLEYHIFWYTSIFIFKGSLSSEFQGHISNCLLHISNLNVCGSFQTSSRQRTGFCKIVSVLESLHLHKWHIHSKYLYSLIVFFSIHSFPSISKRCYLCQSDISTHIFPTM